MFLITDAKSDQFRDVDSAYKLIDPNSDQPRRTVDYANANNGVRRPKSKKVETNRNNNNNNYINNTRSAETNPIVGNSRAATESDLSKHELPPIILSYKPTNIPNSEDAHRSSDAEYINSGVYSDTSELKPNVYYNYDNLSNATNNEYTYDINFQPSIGSATTVRPNLVNVDGFDVHHRGKRSNLSYD